MNPNVSLLVAVYKASAYIEKCVESIFNQTFEDIEYIFVNDATPDNSIEKLQDILERFPKRKEQAKIIHHIVNKGSASSKNEAINVATGNYILFVDSDDYIEPDMVERLYQKAIQENADIVVSDMIMEYSDHSVIVNDYLSDNKNEYFSDLIKNEQSHSFLCNKLVRRSLYLHPKCRVPNGLNYYEDRHIMTRLYYFAKKIVKVDRAFYHYVQYNSSAITKTKGRMHFENAILFWNLFDNFLREHNEFEKYKPILALPKAQSKVRLMIDTHSSQLRKEYADIFQKEERQSFSTFRKGEKLMLLLVRYRLFGLAQIFHEFIVWKNKK